MRITVLVAWHMRPSSQPSGAAMLCATLHTKNVAYAKRITNGILVASLSVACVVTVVTGEHRENNGML